VLVEPLFDVRLQSIYHSVTVTELAIYGKHILGVTSMAAPAQPVNLGDLFQAIPTAITLTPYILPTGKDYGPMQVPSVPVPAPHFTILSIRAMVLELPIRKQSPIFPQP
jgi:hypothetical protein